MALRSVENIIIPDVPAIWIDAYDSTNTVISSNAISTTAYTQLSFQGDGGGTVQLNITVEPHEVKVADFPTAIAAYVNAEDCEIVVKLGEAAVEALRYVVPGSTYAAGATPGTNPDTLTMGGGSIPYYNLAFIVERISADAKNEIAFEFHKVYVSAPPQISFGRGTTAEYEVTFKCLTDTTKSAGNRLFSLTELTNA